MKHFLATCSVAAATLVGLVICATPTFAAAVGIQTFQSLDTTVNMFSVEDAFGATLENLINADVAANNGSTSNDQKYNPNYDGVWGGPNPKCNIGGSCITDSGDPTAAHVCSLTGPNDATFDPNNPYTVREYTSPGSGGGGPSDDEWTIEWVNSAWEGLDAKGGGNSQIETLTCVDYAPPVQTLTLTDTKGDNMNGATVTAGTSLELHWNDRNSYDYYSIVPDSADADETNPYPQYPDPAQVVGSTPENGTVWTELNGGYDLSTSNATFPPDSVCSVSSSPSSSWTNQGTASGHWQSTSASQQCGLSIVGGTKEPIYCSGLTYTWVTGGGSSAEVKSGTYDFTAGSASQSFTYKCTNQNGSTLAKVSYTVAAQPIVATLSPNQTVTLGNNASLTYECDGPATAATIASSTGSYAWPVPPGNVDGSPHTNTTTFTPGVDLVPFTPPITVTYTLACTGPGPNDTDPATISVIAPNLSVGDISPTTAFAGETKSYSATITNTGDASTGGTDFKNILEVASDSKGTGAVVADETTETGAIKANGDTDTLSFQYEPTSAEVSTGYFYARVCADKASLSDTTGDIAESNEGNNCGGPDGWQKINITTINANLTAVTPVVLGNYASLTYTCAGQATAGSISSSTGSYAYALPTRNIDGDAHTTSATFMPGVDLVPFDYPPSTSVTYTLSCSGPGPNDTDPATVKLEAPDLTVASLDQSTAVAGTAENLTATVSNAGNYTTGSTYNDVFEFVNSATKPGLSYLYGNLTDDVADTNNAALAAQGTDQDKISYTFPSSSVSTWYVRDCANTGSTAGATPAPSYGGNMESDYTDNCGAWAKVTVTPAPVPQVVCSGAATNGDNPILIGDTVKWTATVSGGSGTYPTSGYVWSGDCAISGSKSCSAAYSSNGKKPTQLSVTDSSGTTGTGSCFVSVQAPSCSGTNLLFTATPSRVPTGQPTTLSWNVSGESATSCTITSSNSKDSNFPLSEPVKSCSDNDTQQTAAITGETIYTLTCGTDTKQVTVNVLPTFQEF